MCAENCIGPYVAEEDIVCYKALKLKFDNSMHGKPFKAIIENPGYIPYNVEGKITIQEGNMFLCQDVVEGCPCSDQQGFKYSWIYDTHVTALEVEGNIVTMPYTPYQNTPVIEGETYKSAIKVEHVDGVDVINKGLHSYVERVAAIREGAGELLAECIIPKGAKYYKGMYCGDKCYVSNTLKYISISSKPNN